MSITRNDLNLGNLSLLIAIFTIMSMVGSFFSHGKKRQTSPIRKPSALVRWVRNLGSRIQPFGFFFRKVTIERSMNRWKISPTTSHSKICTTLPFGTKFNKKSSNKSSYLEQPTPSWPLGNVREVSSPIYQLVKVEGPSFPTGRASQTPHGTHSALTADRFVRCFFFCYGLVTLRSQFPPVCFLGFFMGIADVLLFIKTQVIYIYIL